MPLVRPELTDGLETPADERLWVVERLMLEDALLWLPVEGLETEERCCEDEPLRWTEADDLCWAEGLLTEAELLLEGDCLLTEALERDDELGRDCMEEEREGEDERDGDE